MKKVKTIEIQNLQAPLLELSDSESSAVSGGQAIIDSDTLLGGFDDDYLVGDQSDLNVNLDLISGGDQDGNDFLVGGQSDFKIL
ncbi:hypothetical protein [Nostoc sp. DedQUE09]|uniref:hypothetical protein n=1 Tax=Nostoc sp. DedQUE09 TaxID=3075394 RepID=UPI002AD2B4FE|nr:hypothetical protein [Nostoc sp. DedQUE09]MDZ7950713.1 hypothetical protein [Nostoc sp. DedQUE09]